MQMLKVLIVDDEALARSRLAALVRECPEPACEVAAECANARQATEWLQAHAGQADVALLDIQMPGALGTELAAEWRHLAHERRGRR
jgi:two-component system response regulator AlgR